MLETTDMHEDIACQLIVLCADYYIFNLISDSWLKQLIKNMHQKKAKVNTKKKPFKNTLSIILCMPIKSDDFGKQRGTIV